jgi:transketolase
MTDIMNEDQNPYLLLGDIGVWGFRHLLEKYPLRAKNIGICEQAMISLASGLSMVGFTPVVHSIAPFLVERAYEQIKIDFGYQELGGNFVSVGASYNYNKLGSTHHCPADVSILSQIPNMQIVVPGSAKEFDILFKESYNNGLPTYFRLCEHTNGDNLNVKFGEVLPLHGTGTRFTMLITGPAFDYVKITGYMGSGIKVLYCTTPVPLDLYTIGRNIESNRLMIVEPYYSAMLPEIVNAFPGLEVISVTPDKAFVDVGFDQEKDMVNRIIWNVRRLKW